MRSPFGDEPGQEGRQNRVVGGATVLVHEGAHRPVPGHQLRHPMQVGTGRLGVDQPLPPERGRRRGPREDVAVGEVFPVVAGQNRARRTVGTDQQVVQAAGDMVRLCPVEEGIGLVGRGGDGAGGHRAQHSVR